MPNPVPTTPSPATIPATAATLAATGGQDSGMAGPPPRSAVRITTVVAVSVVAAVAATVSFMHMHELAARAGEGWRAWLVPLAVDGLVVAASMTMMVRRRAGHPAGWLAWVSMAAGITASLAANVAAAEPTLIGRAVAAWPPFALLLAYELLMDQIRTDTTSPTPKTPDSLPAHLPPPTPPTAAGILAGTPATTAHPATGSLPNTQPMGSPGTHAAPAHGTARINGGTLPPAPILHAVPDTAEATRHAARHYYRQTVAHGQPCTGKQLADHFGMSERWGRNQIRATQQAAIAAASHTTTPTTTTSPITAGTTP